MTNHVLYNIFVYDKNSYQITISKNKNKIIYFNIVNIFMLND